jgi:hypothetical protein
MLPRIEQHKVRALPFRAVRSHIADHSQSGYRRNIASVTHWIDLVQGLVWPLRHVARGLALASATERSEYLDCQNEDRQQVPCNHKIPSWKTMPPESVRMVPQCHLVNIFYHCSPLPSSDDSLGKSHERAEPRSLGGGTQRSAWARPCSRDRPYEGSVSPACLRTVAANRRFAKLYLSPIRAVPVRGLVDARIGGSTVQSVLRCHKLCEIWHAGAYFDRLSRNCKQRRARWRRKEDLNRRDLHFGAATERRADRTEARTLDKGAVAGSGLWEF